MAPKNVWFNGKRYYLGTNGYYEASRSHTTRDKDRRKLHVAVYEYNFGPVPSGMHVHHRDEDKLNNDPANLELVTPTVHYRERHPENIRKAIAAAPAWHSSPEGREWHRHHGREIWKAREPAKYICQYCGKTYESKKRGGIRFCSNNCKVQARRVSGVDNECRVCEQCGREYTVNRYAKKKTCSKECAGQQSALFWAKRREGCGV